MKLYVGLTDRNWFDHLAAMKANRTGHGVWHYSETSTMYLEILSCYAIVAQPSVILPVGAVAEIMSASLEAIS